MENITSGRGSGVIRVIYDGDCAEVSGLHRLDAALYILWEWSAEEDFLHRLGRDGFAFLHYGSVWGVITYDAIEDIYRVRDL